MKRLALSASLLLVGSFFLVALRVVAGPVLHEHFLPDPAEDLALGATTPSGHMPAALQTKSGLVAAPDETQPPAELSPVYGGSRTQTSDDATYYIDRLTTRPDRVKYDEPFRPSVMPFKRLYAFDSVREDMSLGVHSSELSRVPVGGLADVTEDAFFADFSVDLVENVPVRIVSVGPGARIRALHTDPPAQVAIFEDSAENWFVRASAGGRVRVVMQLSIERQTFGSQFRPVSFERLRPYLTPLSDEARQAAQEVAAHVGATAHQSPAGALQALVGYFRQFQESSELPTSTQALQLYKELALNQKGVCRHRAYTFVITALALGLPSRMVYNEAHAWVEVFDSELWHRIDLGGAATNISQSRFDPLTPTYQPPPDPHTWPRGSQPTQLDVSRQSRAVGDSGVQGASGVGASAAPLSRSDFAKFGPGAASAAGTGSITSGSPGGDEPSEVELRLNRRELLRGRPLEVSGAALRDGKPCPLARVDVYIAEPSGEKIIGSVATDRSGEFNGQVTLPLNTPVGPLAVFARVDGACE